VNIQNLHMFVVGIEPDETEQDCTPLNRSSSFHEFRYVFVDGAPYDIFAHILNRFTGPDGVAMARNYPCFCATCFDGCFHLCANVAYIGSFQLCTMHPLGVRLPIACFNTDVIPEQRNVLIVILGTRIFQERVEYEVLMEGRDFSSWIDADHLNCPELVEEFLQATNPS
jgi:hypothetical protein